MDHTMINAEEIVGEIVDAEFVIPPQPQVGLKLPKISVPCATYEQQSIMNNQLQSRFGPYFAGTYGVRLQNKTTGSGKVIFKKCSWFLFVFRGDLFRHDPESKETETFIRSCIRSRLCPNTFKIKEYMPYGMTADGRDAIVIRIEVNSCPGNHDLNSVVKGRYPPGTDSGVFFPIVSLRKGNRVKLLSFRRVNNGDIMQMISNFLQSGSKCKRFVDLVADEVLYGLENLSIV